MTATEESRRQLVQQRVRSLHIWHTAYDDEASSYCVKGRLFGTLTAVCSAVVATTFVTSLTADNMPNWIQYTAAALGALAAALATVETTLNYSGLAVEYRKRANEFGTVRARAERLLTEEVTKQALEELDAAIATVRDAPQIISDRRYHKAENRVNRADSAATTRHAEGLRSAERLAEQVAEAERAAAKAAERAAEAEKAAERAAEAEKATAEASTHMAKAMWRELQRLP